MGLRYKLSEAMISRRLAGSERRRHRELLEAHAHASAGLQHCDDVMVREIACGDASCPGLETVLLVSPKGRASQILKLLKPLATVSTRDIEEVLERAGLIRQAEMGGKAGIRSCEMPARP